jgi:hypothetical protein
MSLVRSVGYVYKSLPCVFCKIFWRLLDTSGMAAPDATEASNAVAANAVVDLILRGFLALSQLVRHDLGRGGAVARKLKEQVLHCRSAYIAYPVS